MEEHEQNDYASHDEERRKKDFSGSDEAIMKHSLVELKKIGRDDEGKALSTTIVCLNEDDYLGGFQAPFTLVIGSHFDRDTFQDSVERFINDGGIPDKTLKNKFIAWYCEMFRQPQSVFYSKEGLEASVDKVGNMINGVANATETLIKAEPIKEIELVKKVEEDSYGL